MIKQLTPEEHEQFDAITRREIADIEAARNRANQERSALVGYDLEFAQPFITQDHMLYSGEDQRRLSEQLQTMAIQARTGFVSGGPTPNTVTLSEGAREALGL